MKHGIEVNVQINHITTFSKPTLHFRAMRFKIMLCGCTTGARKVKNMKKIISIITFITFFYLLNVYADDAFIRCYGGGVGNVKSTDQFYELGQEDDIVMTSEHVFITMYDEYYTVDAKFWFKNEGNEKTISIGFPENNCVRFGKREEFEDFKTYVDDKKVEVKKYLNPENDMFELSWHVKQVHFDKGQVLQTRVQYKCHYGTSASGLYFGNDGFFSYVYGTGKSWKGSIGKITVDIKNLTTTKYIMNIGFLGKEYGSIDSYGVYDYKPFPTGAYTFNWISPDTFRLEAENVEPEYSEECIDITIHSFDYIRNWSNTFEGETAINARCNFTKAFMKYELCYMTEKQLRLARNDFYALHGREFKNKAIKDFYESILGYKIDKNYSDDLLSEEETKLIERIIEIENVRKNK